MARHPASRNGGRGVVRRNYARRRKGHCAPAEQGRARQRNIRATRPVLGAFCLAQERRRNRTGARAIFLGCQQGGMISAIRRRRCSIVIWNKRMASNVGGRAVSSQTNTLTEVRRHLLPSAAIASPAALTPLR